MTTMVFDRVLVMVRGGGDLASGVVYRLHRAGFPVVIAELAVPLLVRRAVSFGEAMMAGTVTVEDITARRIASATDVRSTIERGEIPVLCDPDGSSIADLQPVVIVDARMEKRSLDTRIDDAPLVIALGPGYSAGENCHAVIETNRGHWLGRVIWNGSAEPDTGVPGRVDGKTKHDRVLRAPVDGYVEALIDIGGIVEAGQVIARVDGQPVIAPFAGVLRGLVNSHLPVRAGMKIGDLDPRSRPEHCFTISDKSLAIGGGVLEAILSAPQVRGVLQATL